MAIDVHCPFCDKAYKLKDDLAGKRVTCANQDCRKVFTANPSANGAAKPPAPGKPAPPPDAEALAAAAFSDEDAPAGPEDTRTIEMKCAACDHVWPVPWAMQGKNVLCPECRARQKVPEQKKAGKADWRDARQPSLAKVERLEGVQTSTEAGFISGKTIQEAGLIEVEYEPRPFLFYVKIGMGILAGVVIVAGLVMYSLKSRTERKEEDLHKRALEAIDSAEMKNLPKEVAPLYEAALRIAAGEYDARRLDQEHRDRAVKEFGEARAGLEKAPRSAERDALFGELAVALLALGGTDAHVMEHVKLPWVPLPPKNSRAQIKPNQAEAEGVQGQLRRVFEAMKEKVEFDLRAATARRVARELIRHDQVQMLLDTLQAGFTDPEQPEVRGQIGLELLRAGKADKAREVAEGLKTALAAGGPAATPPASSAQALWLGLDPPVAGAPTVAAEPSGGEVSDASRLAYTALRMIQGKPDAALEVAMKPGKSDGRLRALALAAEWAAQPIPFVDAAAGLTDVESRKQEAVRSMPSGQVLIRLARATARAGQGGRAGAFIKPIPDEGLREWGRAEVLREKLAANPEQEAKDDEAPVPEDVKNYHLGNAWGRLYLARHNARRTADRGLAQKYRIAWPTNTIGPFGQVGVALGLQDAEQK